MGNRYQKVLHKNLIKTLTMKKPIIIHLLGSDEVLKTQSFLLKRAITKRHRTKGDSSMKVVEIHCPDYSMPTGTRIKDYIEKNNSAERLTPNDFYLAVVRNHIQVQKEKLVKTGLINERDLIIVSIYNPASQAYSLTKGVAKQEL